MTYGALHFMPYDPVDADLKRELRAQEQHAALEREIEWRVRDRIDDELDALRLKHYEELSASEVSHFTTGFLCGVALCLLLAFAYYLYTVQQ